MKILAGWTWSALVRPTEFDQLIRITQTYTDSQGNEQTVIYDVQDDLSQNAFYLKFVHDGEGGGDFVIENVPKSVKDAAGVECQVSSYSVNVEPTLPYYKCIDLSYEEIYEGFLKQCSRYAIWQQSGELPSPGTGLLTLSTCEYSQTDGRLVIVAAQKKTQ